MTARFAWVDGQEMFSLVLARDAGHEELAEALTGGEAERLPTVDSWPSRGGAVKVVTGEQAGWAFALAFERGHLMSDDALDAIARRWDVVSMWFDIYANSEFRSYRDGVLVRRCAVIGYDFEPSEGNPLPEEQGLFIDNVEWDYRSDGLELVARVTQMEPSESWWSTAPLAWAVQASF
jgi:hypothetical protein